MAFSVLRAVFVLTYLTLLIRLSHGRLTHCNLTGCKCKINEESGQKKTLECYGTDFSQIREIMLSILEL